MSPLSGIIGLHLQGTTPSDTTTKGANVTWDFPFDMTTGTVDTVFLVHPPGGSSTITNRAELASSNTYHYELFLLTDNVLRHRGSANPFVADGGWTWYSEGAIIRDYPLSYGKSWTEALHGRVENGWINDTITGSSNGQVDGWGTLVLGTDTFLNVIRLRNEEILHLGFNTCTQKKFEFISADYMYPLLEITFLKCEPSGGESWLIRTNELELPAGTKESLSELEVEVFPNPAHNQLTILAKEVKGPLDIHLTDIAGRKVIRTRPNISNNVPYHLSLEGLPAGLYLIHLAAGNTRTLRKIVIQE